MRIARNITVGIDIGTYEIRVVVAELARGTEKFVPRIIGMGRAESRGMRHGYVVEPSEVTASLLTAVRQAEKTSGVEIKRAFLAVGGVTLGSITSQATLVISRADSEVSEQDVKKVLEICEQELPTSAMLNKKILHAIPIAYKIDGKPVLGRPEGMKAIKFEVRALFITTAEQHLNNLVNVVGEAGIEIDDVMASPIAASLVTLTKTQKIAGCMLANIGAETVSTIVFENNIPIALEVFPIGSGDITNDLALGLKIPLEDAQRLKHGESINASVSKKKYEEIVYARLSDIFELIDAHLKKLGRNELLPAGIVITGGGAGLSSIDEIAKTSLRLPSRIASILGEDNSRNVLKNPSWSVAYGLCIFGFTHEDHPYIGPGLIGSSVVGKTLQWLKQFIP